MVIEYPTIHSDDGAFATAVAPLVWVPWVPWNPSIFEVWGPEPTRIYPLFSSKQVRNRGQDLKIAFWNQSILIPNRATATAWFPNVIYIKSKQNNMKAFIIQPN